jgi:hypothetical protein
MDDKVRAIQILRGDLRHLERWAAKEGVTPERMLGILIAAERGRRAARSE